MKVFPILMLAAGLASCQQRPDSPPERSTTTAAPEPAAATGVAPPASTTGSGAAPAPIPAANKQTLALTSNALQLVSQPSGSSREISLGMPLEPLVKTVSQVLQAPVKSVGVNGECGVGPLKMASWGNGLTLAFQQKQRKGTSADSGWYFVGWYLGDAAGPGSRLTTMAGIGIGSTRAELESAYSIKATKSSLGTEFSTSAGLYGILAGPEQNARVTSLWSGTSCVFR